MHETDADTTALQALLDRSYEAAGEHMRSIFTADRRVSAAELPGMLSGVKVLHLATVTARGEPRVGPVDGLFYRGRFWFGSSDRSMRFRHIRARPQVSAAVTRGEEFAVIVHGRAVEVGPGAERDPGFREYLREVYDDWDDWAAESPYAVIEPERMYANLLRR